MMAIEYQVWDRSSALTQGSFGHTINPSFCDSTQLDKEFPYNSCTLHIFAIHSILAYSVHSPRKKADISTSFSPEDCYLRGCFPISCPRFWNPIKPKRSSLLIFFWDNTCGYEMFLGFETLLCYETSSFANIMGRVIDSDDPKSSRCFGCQIRDRF